MGHVGIYDLLRICGLVITKDESPEHCSYLNKIDSGVSLIDI